MGAKGTTLRGLILPEASRVGKAGFWAGRVFTEHGFGVLAVGRAAYPQGAKPTYKHPSCIFSLPQGGGQELVITKLSDFVKALGNGTLGGDGFFNIGV